MIAEGEVFVQVFSQISWSDYESEAREPLFVQTAQSNWTNMLTEKWLDKNANSNIG